MDEQDLIRKVGALLAKAEGTDNPNEADAFYAKAQELMVKYAIDEEQIRASQRKIGGQVEEPVVEDYMFSSYAHHREAKEALFQAVAKSQHVRVFPYSNRKYSNASRVAAAGKTGLHESQWCMLIGYRSDIEHAKILFISLLIQSQRFANQDFAAKYPGGEQSVQWAEGVGKFTWLSAHMKGFAARIGARFRELTEAIVSAADANALMLDKDTNILEWMYEHGYARRPVPYTPRYYCWTPEPESARPMRADGRTPMKSWEPRYCIVEKPSADEPHEGEHQFTYRPPKSGPQSTYVAKGRATSYSAQAAGREAADRADIGLGRVASGARAIGGGR